MRPVLTVIILLLLVVLGACRAVTTEPGAAPAVQPTATTEPAPEPTPTTAPAEPTATSEPAPTGETAAEAAFCPEIARPALILFLPSDQLLLFDPASGATCPLPIPGRYAGMVQLTESAFFSPAPAATAAGDALVIQRYLPDGTVVDLPYTMTAPGASYTGFVVSPDARLIAWGVIGPTPGSDDPATNLYVASLETGELRATVGPVSSMQPRGLMPVRFDDSGNKLFYAEQPYGIGGSWVAFHGRYDTLYAIATDGSGTLEPLFDCGGGGVGLCIGDFLTVDGAVTALAYVDAQAGTVVVQNGAGQVLNTLQPGAEYVGYPTWSPGGELVFYTADLAEMSDGPPTPAMATLQRVAPPTAPAETLLGDPALALPVGFLDDTHVVVNWITDPDTGTWSLALVGIDGSLQHLDVPPGATIAAIVR
jgi:hypothetical protein